MKKKHFTIITYTYYLVVIVIFVLYASQVMDENWMIDFQDQKYNLVLFGGLFFIALILTAIDGAGVRDKSNKVTINMIYGGLSLATFFLVWRLLMGIF
ncbi:hypothetical protein EKG37_01850 [Robertmurraya yapensis]|uniref:Uncharacterized protein n=2 Tax=Bacillaceae TaxID=186817 RepID=A0A431WM35_9BACI|nr:hypothetical protein [Bacillus yapensis]RTR36324.1 hypothetical protein EKG37_01850 [Bacillus yapensis]TKT05827.1 hypothetical protein FAR12_01850 [Bacillus yapensis]